MSTLTMEMRNLCCPDREVCDEGTAPAGANLYNIPANRELSKIKSADSQNFYKTSAPAHQSNYPQNFYTASK